MPANNSPIISLFGLARRCGKLARGFDAAVAAVASGKSHVFFLTPDAAERTRRNIFRIAEENGASVREVPCTMAELGAGIGSAPTGVVTLLDAGFEKKARTLVPDGSKERDGL